MIRLLIADGDPLVRHSLRRLLSDGVQLSVVGEANAGVDAVTKARWLRPDVVLLDSKLRDGSAVATCRTIVDTLPTTRVLVLGFYDDDDVRREALAAGAAAYLVKDLDLTGLREAIAATEPAPRQRAAHSA